MDARTLRCKREYEGKHYWTKYGQVEFVIKEFNCAADVTIEFIPSGLIKKTNMGNINMGLPNPFPGNACIAFDTLEHEFLGCIYKTNQGDLLRIINIPSKREVTYQFMDNFGYIGTTTIQNIRNGQVRNLYHMNEFGGYLGETPYSGKQHKDLYNIWHSMLVRGTGARSKYECKGYYSSSQYYNTAAICQEWRCYAFFAEWYVSNISKLNPNISYEIDKDLLYRFYKSYTNGFKLYSPATCVLIPRDLNIQIANYNRPGYDKDKIRESIIDQTEYYYKNGAMSNNTYNAIRSQYYLDGTTRNYRYNDNQKERYFSNIYTLNTNPENINVPLRTTVGRSPKGVRNIFLDNAKSITK